jgi:hypothetical protein
MRKTTKPLSEDSLSPGRELQCMNRLLEGMHKEINGTRRKTDMRNLKA